MVFREYSSEIYGQISKFNSMKNEQEGSLKRLQKELFWSKVLNVALLLLTCLALYLGFNNQSRLSPENLASAMRHEVIRVRGLVAEDENGIERVWVGAPVPDPLILGRRISRGESGSGILLFDKDGTERSGYMTFDSNNSVGITFDEVSRMVGNIIANEAGGMRIMMRDEYGNMSYYGTGQDGPFISQRQPSFQRSPLVISPDSLSLPK